MKKIALLLALLLIVGCFAACGGDGENKDATGPAATNGENAPEGSTGEQLQNGDPELCPATDDGKHMYMEDTAAEPSCVEPGLVIYTCSECEYSKSVEIPAPGHQGTGANCEEPSICTACGAVAEAAWGHEPDGGICKNCGIDMNEISAEQPATPETTEPESTTESTAE